MIRLFFELNFSELIMSQYILCLAEWSDCIPPPATTSAIPSPSSTLCRPTFILKSLASESSADVPSNGRVSTLER